MPSCISRITAPKERPMINAYVIINRRRVVRTQPVSMTLTVGDLQQHGILTDAQRDNIVSAIRNGETSYLEYDACGNPIFGKDGKQKKSYVSQRKLSIDESSGVLLKSGKVVPWVKVNVEAGMEAPVDPDSGNLLSILDKAWVVHKESGLELVLSGVNSFSSTLKKVIYFTNAIKFLEHADYMNDLPTDEDRKKKEKEQRDEDEALDKFLREFQWNKRPVEEDHAALAEDTKKPPASGKKVAVEGKMIPPASAKRVAFRENDRNAGDIATFPGIARTESEDTTATIASNISSVSTPGEFKGLPESAKKSVKKLMKKKERQLNEVTRQLNAQYEVNADLAEANKSSAKTAELQAEATKVALETTQSAVETAQSANEIAKMEAETTKVTVKSGMERMKKVADALHTATNTAASDREDRKKAEAELAAAKEAQKKAEAEAAAAKEAQKKAEAEAAAAKRGEQSKGH